MIDVYIDNNIWDFVLSNEIDLKSCFPQSEFQLLISKHGRFEIEQMPDNDSTRPLKAYVYDMLQNCVEEQHRFGFYDPSLPDDEQRASGFGVGAWGSVIENDMRALLHQLHGSEYKRKEMLILKKQEADIELGALSACNFVITLDKKPGPLRSAKENGGKVIFLNEISACPDRSTLEYAAKLIREEYNNQLQPTADAPAE